MGKQTFYVFGEMFENVMGLSYTPITCSENNGCVDSIAEAIFIYLTNRYIILLCNEENANDGAWEIQVYWKGAKCGALNQAAIIRLAEALGIAIDQGISKMPQRAVINYNVLVEQLVIEGILKIGEFVKTDFYHSMREEFDRIAAAVLLESDLLAIGRM